MIKAKDEFVQVSGDTDEILGETVAILKCVEKVLEEFADKATAVTMIDDVIKLYKDSLIEDEHSQEPENFDDIMNSLIEEVHDLHDELIGMLGSFGK